MTYLLVLKLALESKLGEFGDSLTYWELFWKPRESVGIFVDLFGIFELTIVVVEKKLLYNITILFYLS